MKVELIESKILEINLAYLIPGEFFEYEGKKYMLVEKNDTGYKGFCLGDTQYLKHFVPGTIIKVLEQIEPLKLKYQRK